MKTARLLRDGGLHRSPWPKHDKTYQLDPPIPVHSNTNRQHRESECVGLAPCAVASEVLCSALYNKRGGWRVLIYPSSNGEIISWSEVAFIRSVTHEHALMSIGYTVVHEQSNSPSATG